MRGCNRRGAAQCERDTRVGHLAPRRHDVWRPLMRRRGRTQDRWRHRQRVHGIGAWRLQVPEHWAPALLCHGRAARASCHFCPHAPLGRRQGGAGGAVGVGRGRGDGWQPPGRRRARGRQQVLRSRRVHRRLIRGRRARRCRCHLHCRPRGKHDVQRAACWAPPAANVMLLLRRAGEPVQQLGGTAALGLRPFERARPRGQRR